MKVSRLLNALNMYLILHGRNLITVSELADILGVSTRMVKSYRNDLEDAGIIIRSKKGKYGGYYLERGIDLKGFGINREELKALKMAREAIKSGNHFFAKDFEILTNKILNSQNEFGNVDYFGKDTLKPEHMKREELERWNIISKGIVNKRKIKISYQSLEKDLEKRKTKIRTIHPYGTFEYKGSTYFFGYCELRKKVLYFKLSRIQDIEILKDKFAINNKYDIKDMLRKSFGIFDDDEFYLKLKISYPMSQLVKERQYSLNQKITEIDENTIIFEANIKGYEEIKTWVLGMGSNAEVIEPARLKEDVKEEIRKLGKIY